MEKEKIYKELDNNIILDSDANVLDNVRVITLEY